MADTKTKEVEVKAVEPVIVKPVSQPDVSLVEEDDQFEEFEEHAIEGPAATEADSAAPMWEVDWDDEDVKDDLHAKIRAELANSMKS
ncbi:MAG: hypothetical protein WDW36_008059 [Sanguina aurantia]